MSLFDASIPQLTKMLNNLDKWLEKAKAHADKKSFEVDTLLHARLAPDQFSFVKQIQAVCDSAKFAAARLTGKQDQVPKHEDNEKTIEELRQRIQKCVSYLHTFSESDFEGAKTRMIALPFLEGKVISGTDYLNEFALPNFYFHIVTTYAILRHNGVEIGKQDYIGSLKLHDK